MNEFEQRRLITQIVGRAIDTGQIKFEAPPVQQTVVQQTKEQPIVYKGGRITFFDLLTCIMFTLNLVGLTDINWLLVFVPFLFPHVVFYGMLWSVMLWTKFKNRKNKKDGESKTN